MQSPEVEASLIHLLYDFFEEFDFELLPDLQQFRRTTPEGFQNVTLSFTQHGRGVYLDINLGTRIDAIEQIAQPYLQNSMAYRQHANTVITNLGKLQNQSYRSFSVWKRKDIDTTAQAVQLAMADLGFGFLDSVSKAYQVNHLLNTEPHRPSKYVHNQIHRCFKGLTAAHLVATEDLTSLVASYTSLMANLGAADTHLSRFDDLQKDLKAKTQT